MANRIENRSINVDALIDELEKEPILASENSWLSNIFNVFSRNTEDTANQNLVPWDTELSEEDEFTKEEVARSKRKTPELSVKIELPVEPKLNFSLQKIFSCVLRRKPRHYRRETQVFEQVDDRKPLLPKNNAVVEPANVISPQPKDIGKVTCTQTFRNQYVTKNIWNFDIKNLFASLILFITTLLFFRSFLIRNEGRILTPAPLVGVKPEAPYNTNRILTPAPIYDETTAT